MPKIAMIDGMSLYMYFGDHLPPHIHIRTNGVQYAYDLQGNPMHQKLPAPEHQKIVAYIQENRNLLMKKWKEFRGA